MFSTAVRSSLRASRTLSRPALVSSKPSTNVVARITSISNPTSLLASKCFRSISSSAVRFGSGESDPALAARLQEEVEYEKEALESQPQGEPDFIKEFKNEGVWKIEEKPDSDEVALTRQFGNEQIQVIFSIADVNSIPEEDEHLHEEGAEEEAAESEDTFPLRSVITISKNAGALSIDAVCEDGLFIIDNVSFYKDPKLAIEISADADFKRRGLYIGPQFKDLDDNVQSEFERYLEERGINSSLALFIPDLAAWKEQKEYYAWLQNVKKFVEA